MRGWSVAALALAGCGPRVVWDEVDGADLVEDLFRAMVLVGPGGDEAALSGPYLTGSTFPLQVVQRGGSDPLDDLAVTSTDEAVVAVVSREDTPGRIGLVAGAIAEGDAALDVVRPGGGRAERLSLRVRDADGLALRAWDDQQTGRPGALEDGQAVHVVASAEASYVVVPRDEELGPLRGEGASTASAAADAGVRVDGEATPTVRGMDTFIVTAGGAAGSWPVTVVVGAHTLALDVVVHALEEVDGLALEVWEEELRVAPVVTAGSTALIATPIAWSWDGGASTDIGTWLQLEEGEPTEVVACVSGTELCVTEIVPGVPSFAGDGVVTACEGGCSQGGPGAAWAAGLGAWAWAARRRARR
jgi:hypothetical protein